MGEITKPDKVKLIAGLIYSDELLMSKSVNMMKSQYGELDIESEPVPFDNTKYYNDEMGEKLFRKFVSFEELIDPSQLPAIKIFSNDIELRFSRP
ncbi:MAG: DUF4416 family protein, partial [candidate division Zixibacteria bacterium]|nr:DUF4416 family protein [candidate division Zixibacteria bacterium]